MTSDGSGPRIPSATYRLQLHRGFTFADVQALLPYLDDLGITDVYLSPITAAVPGSMHGYDVVDPTRLNPELGGEVQYRALVQALQRRGMGQVLDVVPNHMGIEGGMNPWWQDVLRHGRDSPHARVFDIDWAPPDEALRGKVVLPILGDDLDAVLARGEIALEADGDDVQARYYDHRLPLAPESVAPLQAVARGVTAAVEAANEARTTSAGAARLRALIEAQHYQLESWRTGKARVNYRRFFLIDDLVGVRTEDPEVFALTHALLLRLVREGAVAGMRIDHPDGLADPAAYLERLCAAVEGGDAGQQEDEEPSPPPLYLVLEKILGAGEELPEHWRAHGTSGYDFLTDLNAVFVDSDREEQVTATYERFTGRHESYDEIAYDSRRQVVDGALSGQLDAGSARLHAAIAPPEVGRAAFLAAVRSLVACLPVYRTYHEERHLDVQAPRLIAEARTMALQRGPDLDAVALDAAAWALAAPPEGDARAAVMRLQQLMPAAQAKGLEDSAFYRYRRLLSLSEVGGEPGEFGLAVSQFHRRNTRRHQRWPATMLATATHDHKRGEDVRARLNALPELADEWDGALGRWSSLAAPARVPGSPRPDRDDEYLLYQTLLGTWPADDEAGPEALDALRERMQQHVVKALREAGEQSDWTEPDETYEAAICGFVAALLVEDAGAAFRDDFAPLARRLARLGAVNSLAQVVLKAAAPGVPDTYQGTERWDLSLVDPDNRAAVPFEALAAALERMRPMLGDGPAGDRARAEGVQGLLARWPDGDVKLYVLARALRVRRAAHPLFVDGEYLPLRVEGEHAGHVIAFARRLGERAVVAVAPRLPSKLTASEGRQLWAPDWGDTSVALPAEPGVVCYRELFTSADVTAVEGPTGLRLPLRDVLGRFPVALLDAVR